MRPRSPGAGGYGVRHVLRRLPPAVIIVFCQIGAHLREQARRRLRGLRQPLGVGLVDRLGEDLPLLADTGEGAMG
jgi:hypothetical protein